LPPLAATSAQDFIERILVGRFGIGGAAIGFDFHFGQNRAGSPSYLAEQGAKLGFAVDFVAVAETATLPKASADGIMPAAIAIVVITIGRKRVGPASSSASVRLSPRRRSGTRSRSRSRRFFNFNGTAGIWRRNAIEDAGGWQHDTLTEDLDLSYRAQLKGSDLELSVEEGTARIHIPVSTNAGVEFYLNRSRIVLEAGSAWYLRLRDPHSVVNRGATDRVHLLVDTVMNARLEAMLKDAAYFPASTPVA